MLGNIKRCPIIFFGLVIELEKFLPVTYLSTLLVLCMFLPNRPQLPSIQFYYYVI